MYINPTRIAIATIVHIPNPHSPVNKPAKRYTTKDAMYARPHWYPIANQNHLVLFIYLLIAPIASKHGAQRRLKIIKLIPTAATAPLLDTNALNIFW